MMTSALTAALKPSRINSQSSIPPPSLFAGANELCVIAGVWDDLPLGDRMLGDLLGELIVKPLLELACYGTGKPIVWLLTLGRLRVAMIEPDKRGRRERRWYSLTFTHSGQRYVDPNLVMLVGILFWAMVIVGVVLVVRAA
jgi:hypothetical protein